MEHKSDNTPTEDKPITSQVLEYYHEYSQNQALPKYFSGTSEKLKPHEWQGSSKLQNRAQGSRQSRYLVEEAVSGCEVVSLPTPETLETSICPSSPTSSVASNRRLEWDNGADIGYTNVTGNLVLQKSISLPVLNTTEQEKLRNAIFRLSPEGETTKELGVQVNSRYSSDSPSSSFKLSKPEYVSISSSTSVHRTVSVDSSSSTSSRRNAWKDLMGHIGLPAAESTPKVMALNIQSDSENIVLKETPKLVQKNSKTKIVKTIVKSSGGQDILSEPQADGGKLLATGGEPPTLSTNRFIALQTGPETRDNEHLCSKSRELIKNLSQNPKSLKKPSKGGGKIVKSIQKKRSPARHRGTNRSLAIDAKSKVPASHDKLIQTSLPKNVSIALQTDLAQPDPQNVRLDSDSNSEERENAPSTTAPVTVTTISRCSSFEYLSGADYDRMGRTSRRESLKRRDEGIPNESSSSASSSSNESPLAALLTSNRCGASLPNLQQNLELLQKVMKSRKYDEVTKKYYVMKIIKKMIALANREGSQADAAKTQDDSQKTSEEQSTDERPNSSLNRESVIESSKSSEMSDNNPSPTLKVAPFEPAFTMISRQIELQGQTFAHEIPPSTSTAFDAVEPADVPYEDVTDRQKRHHLFTFTDHDIILDSDQFRSGGSGDSATTSNDPYNTVAPVSSDTSSPSTTSTSGRAVPNWRSEMTKSEQLRELKTGDEDKEPLLDYAKKERQHQLGWIKNEITHLSKLKKELEKAKTAENEALSTAMQALQKPVFEDMKLDDPTTVYVVTTNPCCKDVKDVCQQVHPCHHVRPCPHLSSRRSCSSSSHSRSISRNVQCVRNVHTVIKDGETLIRQFIFEIPIMCSTAPSTSSKKTMTQNLTFESTSKSARTIAGTTETTKPNSEVPTSENSSLDKQSEATKKSDPLTVNLFRASVRPSASFSKRRHSQSSTIDLLKASASTQTQTPSDDTSSNRNQKGSSSMTTIFGTRDSETLKSSSSDKIMSFFTGSNSASVSFQFEKDKPPERTSIQPQAIQEEQSSSSSTTDEDKPKSTSKAIQKEQSSSSSTTDEDKPKSTSKVDSKKRTSIQPQASQEEQSSSSSTTDEDNPKSTSKAIQEEQSSSSSTTDEDKPKSTSKAIQEEQSSSSSTTDEDKPKKTCSRRPEGCVSSCGMDNDEQCTCPETTSQQEMEILIQRHPTVTEVEQNLFEIEESSDSEKTSESSSPENTDESSLAEEELNLSLVETSVITKPPSGKPTSVETKQPSVETKPPSVETKPRSAKLILVETKPPSVKTKPRSAKLISVETKPPSVETKPPSVETKPRSAKLILVETKPRSAKLISVETKPPSVETKPRSAKLISVETKPPSVETKPPSAKLILVEAKLSPVQTVLPSVETEPQSVQTERHYLEIEDESQSSSEEPKPLFLVKKRKSHKSRSSSVKSKSPLKRKIRYCHCGCKIHDGSPSKERRHCHCECSKAKKQIAQSCSRSVKESFITCTSSTQTISKKPSRLTTELVMIESIRGRPRLLNSELVSIEEVTGESTKKLPNKQRNKKLPKSKQQPELSNFIVVESKSSSTLTKSSESEVCECCKNDSYSEEFKSCLCEGKATADYCQQTTFKTAPRLCECCQKNNATPKQPPLVVQGERYFLCHHCHGVNQNVYYYTPKPYFTYPGYVCTCYAPTQQIQQAPTVVQESFVQQPQDQTVEQIRKTLRELNDLENNCECNSKFCSRCQCKLNDLYNARKGGLAYLLTVESDHKLRSDEEEEQKNYLKEIKVKVPSSSYRRRKLSNNNSSSSNELDPSKSKKTSQDSTKSKSDHNKKEKKGNPSLQDYLSTNHPNFVSAAEERRKVMLELAFKREQRCEKYKQLLALTNGIKAPSNAGYQKNLLYTAEEMKQITAKNYSKLPEVQQKLLYEREQRIRKANKMLADNFNHNLRERVLKGKLSLPTTDSVIKF